MTTPSTSKPVPDTRIRAIVGPDDLQFISILDRVEKMLSTSISSGREDLTLLAQIVYLQDARSAESIVLPVTRAPVLLFREGRSYVTNIRLDQTIVSFLMEDLNSLLKTVETGRISRGPVTGTSLSHQETALPADFVIFVPRSEFHVKLTITGDIPSMTDDALRFTYGKDGTMFWNVDLACGNESRVNLSIMVETLHVQHGRMQGGQTHGYSLLVRDFIRNSVAVAEALNDRAGARPHPKLFFPGVFDLAADVKQHYNEKVGRFISQEQSEAGGIRKFNNLVKSILLNHFVPGGSSAARSGPVILDLACGHGQDLMKYRTKFPKLYVGLDISQEALNEARRRQKTGKARYPAEFIQGNLMLPETYAEIRKITRTFGISDEAPFDIISMQLALHYLVGTADEAKSFFTHVLSMLKPGGRFIATFPCCDRIARRLRTLKAVAGSEFSELSFGSDTYRVTLKAEEIARILPELSRAITDQSDDLLERGLEEIDFEQVSQKVSETWGAQYKFYLVDTIDNQEEYIVPTAAMTSMLTDMKFDIEMTGNFAEIISHYTKEDSPVIRDFRKYNPTLELTPDEEEVFRFYRSIVIRKD